MILEFAIGGMRFDDVYYGGLCFFDNWIGYENENISTCVKSDVIKYEHY